MVTDAGRTAGSSSKGQRLSFRVPSRVYVVQLQFASDRLVLV